MTHEQAARIELAAMLRSHHKLVKTDFSLVSLLNSLGHDHRDWADLALDGIYQYWAKAYSQKYDEKTAATKAHRVAAYRAGILLKDVLHTLFKGRFEAVGRSGAGRFGGPMTYRWINT